MIARSLAALGVAGWALAAVAGGPGLPESVKPEPAVVRVAGVESGCLMRLDDGRMVRLAAIRPPPGPLEASARTALERLVREQAVRLAFDRIRIDRHGRTVAHPVRTADGLWLQAALVADGLALVQTTPDERIGASALLAAEAAARRARVGVWRQEGLVLTSGDPGPLGRQGGRFRIVEDVVVAAARVRDQVYLNFGSDWRRDFTVRLGPDALRRWRDIGVDPIALQGQRIRVRGIVQWQNGPLIEASHPEQIEKVD